MKPKKLLNRGRSGQLFFIGIVGEYIGAIHTQVLHRRPLIAEKERINF